MAIISQNPSVRPLTSHNRTLSLPLRGAALEPNGHLSNGEKQKKSGTKTAQTNGRNGDSTRPRSDTVADIPAIISACRGTEENQEFVAQTQKGLRYLSGSEDEYLISPQTNGTHTNGFGSTQYAVQNQSNGEIKHNSRTPSKEVFVYHGYWSGAFTWRIELFIKSFLATQNIPLSQLWLWVDVSSNENAIDEMMRHPLVQQFLPLLDKGTLAFKPWVLPKKIPVRGDLDHHDGVGFVDNMERRGAYTDSELTADGIIRDPAGQHWLLLQYWARPHDLSQVAMSDIVRFVVLHLHGGVYFDVDIILLRDFRPLLLHDSDWAERWGALSGKGDYNTAILRLHAQSSLSTWFLRMGMRLALNFHPRVLGNQLRKDGRNGELLMLESATFDPVWVEFAGMREGPPTMPCLSNFTQAFESDGDDQKGNRSAKNFYDGSYAYHIHNLWKKVAEPGSWIDVIKQDHDKFFRGEVPNRYNERWALDPLDDYS